MTSLRVLVVNWLDRENPQAGGAEIHLHEIFGRLVSAGHVVTLIASGWPGAPSRATLDGIGVHRTGGRHSFSLAAPRYFRAHLASQSFDVVVEDLNKVPLFTPFWTRLPVGLLVHHLFGATAFQEASWPMASATWLLERPIPRVFRNTPTVSVSESTKADLVLRGMDANHIEVIPNGIDLDALTPDPAVRRFETPTVLFLGRLKKYKRVDLLIRAMGRLAAQGVPGRLLIAGKGDHQPQLEALASRLGLSERVKFLGFVSEEEKLDLFRRTWVHGLTSPKEGWGIANMEAAACGTATVSSDSPGLRESVVHGETGLLTPHGDVEALAAALGSILGDGTLRDTYGMQARAFSERFSWDASAVAMEAFLGRVVASKSHD